MSGFRSNQLSKKILRCTPPVQNFQAGATLQDQHFKDRGKFLRMECSRLRRTFASNPEHIDCFIVIFCESLPVFPLRRDEISRSGICRDSASISGAFNPVIDFRTTFRRICEDDTAAMRYTFRRYTYSIRGELLRSCVLPFYLGVVFYERQGHLSIA